MYEVLALALAIGFLTKLVDLVVDDGLKIPKIITYVAAIAYGILIAYVISNYPLIAPLYLAVVLAVLVTRKIDSKPHFLGMVSMVLFLGIWRFAGTDLFLLAIFIVAGIEDEILSDLVDKGRIKGKVARVLEKRVILEVTAFAVSLVTWQWIIFLAIFIYDAGYLLTQKILVK